MGGFGQNLKNCSLPPPRNTTTVLLPLPSCYFLDFPNGNLDCEEPVPGSEKPVFCYYCRFRGQFLTGEGLDDYYKAGHVICLTMFVFLLFMGIFGMLANALIIEILRRRKGKKAFDTFLITLAIYDVTCSIFSIVGALGGVLYFQNLSRGRLPLYLYYFGTFTTLLGRSGSTYMTVLISFERYVVVAFPLKTLHWFDLKRTRILAACSLVVSLVTAVPRYVSAYVTENTLGKRVGATRGLDYIIMSTPMEKFFYVTLKGYFNQVDFWAPLPLLLLFNGLVYFHIFRHNANKTALNVSQKQDIRVFRMFIPVVVVLFLCNITPIILNYYLLIKGIYYRELAVLVGLSYALNSAVNLPIYYFGGANFRKETKDILNESFPRIATCLMVREVEQTHSSASVQSC